MTHEKVLKVSTTNDKYALNYDTVKMCVLYSAKKFRISG